MELNKYAFAFAALLAAPAINAQWITLTDGNGTDVTNGSVSEWELTSGTTQVIHLDATITGSVGRTVNVKRYEVNVQTGSQNYFCWALCYLPQDAGNIPLWVSGDTQAMSPGTTFSGFGGYHIPTAAYATNAYRYVFYDVNNPTDSAFVDLNFAGVVGVNDAAALGSIALYPNPAIANTTVSFGNATVDGLAVFNALGEQVYVANGLAADRNVVVPVGALNNGVYFVSMLKNGRAIATRRLVVSH